MSLLPPNQQRQSTEGTTGWHCMKEKCSNPLERLKLAPHNGGLIDNIKQAAASVHTP